MIATLINYINEIIVSLQHRIIINGNKDMKMKKRILMLMLMIRIFIHSFKNLFIQEFIRRPFKKSTQKRPQPNYDDTDQS